MAIILIIYENNKKNQDIKVKPKRIIMATIYDAHTILNYLNEMIRKCNLITLADYYDACGLVSTFSDTHYGWNDISSAYIERKDGGYTIIFPPMKLIY